tara:strand:- start:367 stop:1773 length:1407 start_codon:yes stop_codon:yes gene_type:complete
MGLLDNTTHREYYQGSNFGNYQFTSLDDIVSNFIVSYVGEDKIISKIKRADVAFHAQRALQEFSFDTFKSCKTQEIEVPAALTMPLPHDYVNYVKLTWSDASGVEHIIYPTSKTSNPQKIQQDDDGNYFFGPVIGDNLIVNSSFDDGLLAPWFKTQGIQYAADGTAVNVGNALGNKVLRFNQPDQNIGGETEVLCVWQEIDVTGLEEVVISATKTASTYATTTRLSLSSTYQSVWNNTQVGGAGADPGDLGSVEWVINEGGSKSATIDVTNQTAVWVLIQNIPDGTSTGWAAQDDIDTVSVKSNTVFDNIQTAENSTTWDNYKTKKSAESNINDYQDYQNDNYWPNQGERYGLDPQHAQVNGSYYIDCKAGKIHFSSNISGKTVILEYISDSLGTDGEMQVHKFAEEAMYKWIAYGILSVRPNIPEYVVQRYKKERFAETRKAKLRLSNIKLEEITQIFRGRSKQIKH